MALSTAEHRATLQEMKQRRNSFQRELRAAPPHFVRVLRTSGEIVLAAQSRSALGVAYEVRQTAPGKWACTCQGYKWRGRCAHSDAAEARQ